MSSFAGMRRGYRSRRCHPRSPRGLVCWFIVAGLFLRAGAVLAQDSDREKLEALYHATDGPNWVNDTNWLTDASLDDWYGIAADGEDRVTELVLGVWSESQQVFQGNGLTGTLPADALGGLRRTKLLEIVGSPGVTGPLPPLANLLELEELDFEANDHTGPIPPEWSSLPKLANLDVEANRLTGPIPPELGRLPLTRLAVGANRLTGGIPAELARLAPTLEELTVHDNQLSGPIPVELGELTNLVELTIDGDTGLCLPRQIQATVFGRLAIGQGVPLCSDVPALPIGAVWVLAAALAASAAFRGRRVGKGGRPVTHPPPVLAGRGVLPRRSTGDC